MKLDVITPPLGTPITYDQFAAHARLPDTNDKDYCLLTIKDAVSFAESEIDGSLFPQTLQMTSYHRPHHGVVPLWRGPVQSIVSVTLDGNLMDSSAYDLRCNGNSDYLYFYNISLSVPIVIQYVAGYPVDNNGLCHIPADLRRALLIQTSQFYEFREGQATRTLSQVQNGLQRIYDKYKRTSLIG